MITSAAERPSPLCRSTGMPRPSSSTVTELSEWMVTSTVERVAGLRLVDRVVDQLEDHVVQTRGVVGVADVHAGALAHRLEALEDLDVFGGVGAACWPRCALAKVGTFVAGSLVESPENLSHGELRQTSV